MFEKKNEEAIMKTVYNVTVYMNDGEVLTYNRVNNYKVISKCLQIYSLPYMYIPLTSIKYFKVEPVDIPW